jgi:hypothetical protein
LFLLIEHPYDQVLPELSDPADWITQRILRIETVAGP